MLMKQNSFYGLRSRKNIVGNQINELEFFRAQCKSTERLLQARFTSDIGIRMLRR